MRFLPGIASVVLTMTLLSEVTATIVYVPGRVENGVYVQPHFRAGGHGGARPHALEALMEPATAPLPQKLAPGAGRGTSARPAGAVSG